MGVAGLALGAYNLYKGQQGARKAGSAAANLKQQANRPYEELQGYLPPALRHQYSGPIVGEGIQGIGNMIRNPGQLETQVGTAAAPGVAAQSQDIGQQFRNQQLGEAGAAGAQNLPASVKALLQASSGAGQEKAQRGARTGGLAATAKGKRADLAQTYDLLNTLLQFISSGRGQAIPGLTQKAQQQYESGQTSNAANLAALSSLLQSYGSQRAPVPAGG